MVVELSGRHALPREVVDDVATRTGGVPLFVEEPTRLLLERGTQGSTQLKPFPRRCNTPYWRDLTALAVGVGEPGRQLAWVELRLLERHHDNALPDVVGNAVPNPIRLRWLVFEGFRLTRSEPVIPAIECRRFGSRASAAFAGPADAIARRGRCFRSFSDAGSLMFGLPQPRSCFF